VEARAWAVGGARNRRPEPEWGALALADLPGGELRRNGGGGGDGGAEREGGILPVLATLLADAPEEGHPDVVGLGLQPQLIRGIPARARGEVGERERRGALAREGGDDLHARALRGGTKLPRLLGALRELALERLLAQGELPQLRLEAGGGIHQEVRGRAPAGGIEPRGARGGRGAGGSGELRGDDGPHPAERGELGGVGVVLGANLGKLVLEPLHLSDEPAGLGGGQGLGAHGADVHPRHLGTLGLHADAGGVHRTMEEG
jgi:hypothetical protein